MKSFVLIALALTATQANAGSLNLDMRADWLGTSYNDAAGLAAAGTNNGRFVMQTGRLDYQGKLNDQTSFRFRYRFNRNNIAAGTNNNSNNANGVTTRDTLNSNTDFAFVAWKFNDMFTLTMGKQSTEWLGFEGLTPGPEMYHYSEASNGEGYLGAGTTRSVGGILGGIYQSGAKLTATMGDHKVSLMAMDLTSDVNYATSTTLSAQTRMLTGLAFTTVWLDKSLTVLGSYHMESPREVVAAAAQAQNNYMSLGVGYKLGDFSGHVDYLQNIFKNPVTTTTENKDTMTTIAAKLIYNISNTMSAQVKYHTTTSLKSTAGTDVTDKYDGMSAAFEWKPKAEDNFRYHVAAIQRNMTPEVGDKRQISEIVVGTRINADFLK